ncbi:g2708 [Coccomyxa viridis]|uniref:G2708 protein n=1 Tax=Coccomyxa viridis TaxID=1274662 RepID=A0ABP1FT58_9CHLO
MFSGDDPALDQGDNAEDGVPPPPPPLSEHPAAKRQKTTDAGADEVRVALERLVTHISNPRKFKKASALLRQLLKENKVTHAHSALLFQALRAAMKDPNLAVDPTMTIEYQKLFTAASNFRELFSQRQKGQLDVYGLWGVLRGQLLTDDSFVFNKVLKRIRESIEHLSDATEEDEDALLRVKERLQAEGAEQPEAAEAKAAPEEGPAAEPNEADPFGLDQIIEKEEATKKEQDRDKAWSSRESMAMKRDALLDCLDTARDCYRHAWARTSVDIAIQDLQKNRSNFCSSQQPRIDALWKFVQEQRAVRRKGPTAREARRDTTAFEAARAEWGKADLSIKGGVGAEGDHRSEVWLG